MYKKILLYFLTIVPIIGLLTSCGSTKTVKVKKAVIIHKPKIVKKEPVEFNHSYVKLMKKIKIDREAKIFKAMFIGKKIYLFNDAGYVNILSLDGRRLSKFKILRNVSTVSISKKYIFIGSENGYIALYDIASGKRIDKRRVKRYVTASLYDKKSFLYALEDGTVNRYDVSDKTSHKIYKFPKHHYVTDLQKYKGTLYLATMNGRLYKYSYSMNKILNVKRYIFDIEVYKNNIYICKEGGSLTQYDYINNRKKTKRVVQYDDIIKSYVNKYNVLLLTSNFDFMILNPSLKKIRVFKGHGADIVSMDVYENNILLSDGSTIYLYR